MAAPRFDVMMSTVFLKSTVRPFESVRRPSSITCKQDVEDVGMRLLDFIEQNNGVGAAANGLSQLAAFVVAYIARGRADEASHGVLLHVLAHVDADHGVLVVKEEFGERAGGFGFAHARRPEENEGTNGPLGIA